MAAIQGTKKVQTRTVGIITNNNQTDLKLDSFKNWSGSFSGASFPQTIPANTSVMFTHLPTVDGGSKAGVSYKGLSPQGVEAGVVFAWYAPMIYDGDNDYPNKIFALGAKNFGADWEGVERCLDKSETSFCGSYGIESSILVQPPETAALVADLIFTF